MLHIYIVYIEPTGKKTTCLKVYFLCPWKLYFKTWPKSKFLCSRKPINLNFMFQPNKNIQILLNNSLSFNKYSQIAIPYLTSRCAKLTFSFHCRLSANQGRGQLHSSRTIPLGFRGLKGKHHRHIQKAFIQPFIYVYGKHTKYENIKVRRS